MITDEDVRKAFGVFRQSVHELGPLSAWDERASSRDPAGGVPDGS